MEGERKEPEHKDLKRKERFGRLTHMERAGAWASEEQKKNEKRFGRSGEWKII